MGRTIKSNFDSSEGLTKVTMNDDKSMSIVIDPNKIHKKFYKLPSTGEVVEKAEAKLSYREFFDPSFYYDEGNSNTDSVVDIENDIKLAVRHYFNDPLIGKIIELMTIFSNDGFRNEVSDPKIKEFYDQWCRDVKMDQVLTWIFTEYYRSGNVYVARQLSQHSPSDKRVAVKGKIPFAYTVLNPLSVRVSGSSYFNNAIMELETGKNDALIDFIRNAGKKEFEMLRQMFVIDDVVSLDKFKKNGYMRLNNENVKRVLRLAQPYEPLARPMTKRAFKDIYLKAKLKQLDLSTINGAIHQIIKVTIGDENHVATPNKLAKVAAIFKKQSKTLTVVWDHTLKVEVVRPSDPAWMNKDKYEEVNDSIRSAFGISKLLTGTGSDGAGGNNAYLSVKSFVGNLLQGRKDVVVQWLHDEYRYIAEQMGFDEVPVPIFNPLSLGDEVRERQIISTLVEKGILSFKTAQEYLGYDPETEENRRREEIKLIKEGVYPKGKSDTQSGPNGRPAGQSGDYPPVRMPTTQKRLKGKGSSENGDIDNDAIVSFTGSELKSEGIETKEQLMNFLREKTIEKVQDIQKNI